MTLMNPLRQTLKYIRSLDHDGCQNVLKQIGDALEKSNGKVLHDNIRNTKIVRNRYDDEKSRSPNRCSPMSPTGR